MGADAGAHRAVLPEDGTEGRTTADWPEPDVALVVLAAVVRAADPGTEEAPYDMESIRRFAGFELGEDAIPDKTMNLDFRRLLETHKLTDQMLAFHRYGYNG